MKATIALLADHKLIRKVLEGFTPENPRFPEILKTLHRTVVGHAWFEDQIFLPAFEAEPLLQRRFLEELYQEHKDIDFLLKQTKKTRLEDKAEFEAISLQLRTVLATHFNKEEDALFPLAEKILDDEGLNNLGDEMKRRQAEIRNLV
jgi:hemerythrin-like domain-containing protein